MNNGKICVSVCAETADKLIEQIKRAENLADVIEIRFDCLNENEFEKVKKNIEILKVNSKKPFLITFRPDEQGGKRKLDYFNDRINFWLGCREIREMDFVDIEFDLFCDEGHNWKLYELKKAQFICSYHNFNETYKELDLLYARLSNTKLKFSVSKKDFHIIKSRIENSISKIAIQTHDITDSLPVWELIKFAKKKNREIIPIAMGEAGKWTRILGLAHGAFMTYAALDAGQETAPGQVSARDLLEVYRAKELNENTEVYGILGSNTSVSMSPYIHNAAFKYHHLNSVFVPLQVHNLDEFITRMVKSETREIELNFQGFSVTIPHKQTIIKHLDYLDETARKIGAVNTVKIIDGKLHGYNTDADGFIEPLLNSYGDLTGARVAILGAGGAARACVYALQQSGAKATIFARDIEKARSFADEFGAELKELVTDRLLAIDYKDFDILVNTTPLGMKGKAEGETPATAEQLKGLHLVYDLVYIPFQTALMTQADAAEVPKIGGLAMLIAQAMEQQKIWTGKDAPMREMSRAALERLQ
ncbi:MAG TPA: shikimate dehydrogenase [Pyrinomonadaceae bacterium]|jgi:3-dehydroquinate dehydratase/shikimate dehydrogenase